MTNDELVDALADLFAELHARVDAEKQTPDIVVLNDLVHQSHKALNEAHKIAVDLGLVTRSGGVK